MAIMDHEIREAFLRILSVAKALEGDGVLTEQDRENMASNIEEPLYQIAGILGRRASQCEFGELAAEAGLTDWGSAA